MRVRGLGLAALIGALGLAAYGQHIIDDAGTLGAGWPVLSIFDDELTAIYRTHQSLAFSIPLFIVAAGLFLLSLRLLLSKQADEVEDASLPRDWLDAGKETPVAIGLGALAVGGWSLLIAQLVAGGNQASNLWLFWGSLVCGLVALLLVDLRRGATPWSTLRWHGFEYVLVAAIVGLFVGLVVQDLTSWQYSRIGDEGVFFEYGKTIAEGTDDLNYLSNRGPMGVHPVMSSVYQGWVMRVIGVDMFGWKFASLLAIAASLPVFYWFVRTQFGVRPAAFGTAILGASHYLFAYAHTGYLNIFALFPTILAFACFSAGVRADSALLLFGSGVAAGFGFYTFYSARLAVVILAIVLAFLAMGARRTGLLRWLRRVPLPVAAGFAFSAAPIFAVDGWAVIEAMQQESLLEGKGFTEGLGLLLDNVPRAFMAFNFQRANHHYVSGSLLDEISAVLAMLGFAVALYRLREPAHRFLVVWAVTAIVVAGVFHPRALTELPSRMHYALPPVVALAGLGLDRIVAGFASLSSRRRLELALSVVAFAVVVPAVLGFNVHRFWWETPSRHQLSVVTVVYREARSEPCVVEGYRSVVFIRAQSINSVREVFTEYRLEDESPLVLPYEGPQDLYGDLIDVTRVSCILLVDPEHPTAGPVVERYVALGEDRNAPATIETDTSGKSKVLVMVWSGGG